MGSISHRGYEERTSGYGRRRHKASGFKKKGSAAGTAAKAVVGLAVAVGAVALVYLFADNIMPFVKSLRGEPKEVIETNATVDTPDAQRTSNETGDTPEELPLAEGCFDEVDGSIFISNGAGYKRFKGIDTTARNYAAVLNSVSRTLPSNVDIGCAVIPTNTEFGLDGRLEGSNSQKENIKLINTLLSDRVASADVYGALLEHKNDYIFYRTDECLTSLGAYYVYNAVAQVSGIEQKDIYKLSDLSKKKYGISPFEGSYIDATKEARKQPNGNQELFNNADSLEYYKLPVHYDCFSVDPVTKEKEETDLFSDKNAAADPLSVFPGKDTPFLMIYNLQSSNTDKLLIVKDHAAEAVLGYLIPHYSEIYIADVSLYKGNIMDIANEYSVTDVLFINGIDNANNSLYCQRLRDLFDNSISDQRISQ